MSDDGENDGTFSSYIFELSGVENGTVTWTEEYLMKELGYQDKKSFRKLVTRAMRTCLSMEIDPTQYFIPRGDGGHKFTRLACYLVAMNGDNRKPKVAQAQAYFAALADVFLSYGEQANALDRVRTREEMTDGLKSLSNTAKQHGVERYDLFMNAGYRGMYNMNLSQIAKLKGVGFGEKLIDRMDRSELAANLFRITQTDDKIKAENIHGQVPLEQAAETVGQQVRETMWQISGKRPEELPLAPHIKEVKKTLQRASHAVRVLGTPAASRDLRRKALDDGYEELKELGEDGGAADPGYTPNPDGDSMYDDTKGDE